MSARDLAAEWAADRARAELEALRELRAAVLAAVELVRKSNRYERLTEAEGERVAITFTSDGMGPYTTLSADVVFELADLAKRAAS